LKIAEWKEDDKGSLNFRFDNGMELRIGSREREQKIEQFLAVYPKYIAPQQDRIAGSDCGDRFPLQQRLCRRLEGTGKP